MMDFTLTPGILKFASAFPDPPFEVEDQGEATGFDLELMQEICGHLQISCELDKYAGDDFNGIFDGLANGNYDAVISGTTITPARQEIALFSDPYLKFNQGLAVNVHRTPDIKSLDQLQGQIVGIQVGNTSDRVAKQLLDQGAIKGIKYYPYHGIVTALDDLSDGTIGAFIKLFPVLKWLTKNRAELAVVQQIPTNEQLAIAFALTNTQLCDAVNNSLRTINDNGIFRELCQKWLGDIESKHVTD
jgi:ABC-type amino acid transport substrate-binding protein